MKNKKILYTGGLIILLLLIVLVFFMFNSNSNLVKLSYNEILEKIDNKESFVLCVSATYCSHCQNYKPKLKKIGKKYDILIYYVDVDSFSEEEHDDFKKTLSLDGSTPVTIFFKNGEEKTTATRIEGDVSTEKIINKLKKNGFINE